MLYTGCFFIVNGQNIKKIGFGNFQFSAAEGGKLHKRLVPQPLRSRLTRPSKHPRERVAQQFVGSGCCG